MGGGRDQRSEVSDEGAEQQQPTPTADLASWRLGDSVNASANDTATVLVLGAQGVVGGMCVKALRDDGLTVIRAGRRPEAADDFRLIDLDEPTSVAQGFQGVDLVISTVYHPAQAAEKHILHEGGMLLSVAGTRPAERTELVAGNADANGLVVLDAGLSPGASSLVLKDMLTQHPEADGVEGAGTFSAFEPSGYGAAADFHYAFALKRRHPTRVIDFPAPVGPRRCVALDVMSRQVVS